MEFQTSINDGTVVLTISGELDVIAVADLRPEIDRIVEAKPQHARVVLDGLRRIDASGVGALSSLCNRVRANGGTFEVSGVQGQPRMIFNVMKLDQVYGIKE